METTKTARWDRQKKKVCVIVKESGDITDGKIVVGQSTGNTNQEFEPSYIQKIWKLLHQKKVKLESGLKEIKGIEETKFEYEYDDLVKLKKQLAELKNLEELENNKSTKELYEAQLKSVNDDIRSLSNVIKELPK